MKCEKEGGVKPPANNIKYMETPISLKLTTKTKQMVDFIQEHLQVSRSDAIRISITKYYQDLKKEEGVEDVL